MFELLVWTLQESFHTWSSHRYWLVLWGFFLHLCLIRIQPFILTVDLLKLTAFFEVLVWFRHLLPHSLFVWTGRIDSLGFYHVFQLTGVDSTGRLVVWGLWSALSGLGSLSGLGLLIRGCSGSLRLGLLKSRLGWIWYDGFLVARLDQIQLLNFLYLEPSLRPVADGSCMLHLCSDFWVWKAH